MAESNWWEGWVSSAKSKSAEVLEFVRRDIGEFSTAVKNEATTIVGQAKDVVKESLQLDKDESPASVVKRSISSFFEQISDALVPGQNEEDDNFVPLMVQNGLPVELSPFQLKLYELISKDETFSEEISEDERERYESWLAVSTDLISNVDRLSTILSSSPNLREKYSALVPNNVSHSEFWKRYLFRRALLEDSEAEKQRVTKLANKSIGGVNNPDNKDSKVNDTESEAKVGAEEFPKSIDSINYDKGKNIDDPASFHWEKENNFGPDIELTEEEQMRILSEYEKERNSENNKPLKLREKSDIVIVGSSTASQTSSKESSTDGDWEKDFELEDK